MTIITHIIHLSPNPSFPLPHQRRRMPLRPNPIITHIRANLLLDELLIDLVLPLITPFIQAPHLPIEPEVILISPPRVVFFSIVWVDAHFVRGRVLPQWPRNLPGLAVRELVWRDRIELAPGWLVV